MDPDFLIPDANPAIFRQRWKISESTRAVLYSGNMGQKQGLEIVIQTADQLREQKNVLFLMIGNGAAQQALRDYANSLQLPASLPLIILKKIRY